jgi:hypothetical protein
MQTQVPYEIYTEEDFTRIPSWFSGSRDDMEGIKKAMVSKSIPAQRFSDKELVQGGHLSWKSYCVERVLRAW